MMLKTDIEEIRSGIKAGRFTNEAAVRQGVVLRVLQPLSWWLRLSIPSKAVESILRFATLRESLSYLLRLSRSAGAMAKSLQSLGSSLEL
jgi:hypothetical protein